MLRSRRDAVRVGLRGAALGSAIGLLIVFLFWSLSHLPGRETAASPELTALLARSVPTAPAMMAPAPAAPSMESAPFLMGVSPRAASVVQIAWLQMETGDFDGAIATIRQTPLQGKERDQIVSAIAEKFLQTGYPPKPVPLDSLRKAVRLAGEVGDPALKTNLLTRIASSRRETTPDTGQPSLPDTRALLAEAVALAGRISDEIPNPPSSPLSPAPAGSASSKGAEEGSKWGGWGLLFTAASGVFGFVLTGLATPVVEAFSKVVSASLGERLGQSHLPDHLKAELASALSADLASLDKGDQAHGVNPKAGPA